MKYVSLLLLFAVTSCSFKTDTTTTTDSLASVVDSIAVNDTSAVAETTDIAFETSGTISGYKLTSSSSAEQGRMHISFTGQNTFDFSLTFMVADFCSEETSGSVTLDESGVGYHILSADRKLKFAFG